MKQAKTSPIILGFAFTDSLSFRLWQILCKFKQITAYDEYRHITALTKRYTRGTDNWIKKVILPSKAFKRWLTYYSLKIRLKDKIFLTGKKYLPTVLKVFLKKHAPAYFPVPMKPIPPSIQHKWNEWVNTRSNASLDIINFGVIAYNYRIQRPQHLATEMTKLGHRVFYIENEFVYTSSHKLPQLTVTQQSDNLFVVKLSSSINYFIYRDSISEKDKKILLSSFKVLLRKARILNPVAKIDHPFWGSLVNDLSMPVIYDAMDLHAGFKETSAYNLEKEQTLLKQSDIILSSSDYLTKQFHKFKSKTLSLKNAGEYSHFAHNQILRNSPPPDFAGLKHPIIGYYGAIADWFNPDLIEGVAKSIPEASIVLIGHVSNERLLTLASRYPNIHLLGEKSYSDLPRYLASFDVCLIPFKLTKLIQATNPVKIYEYFASGKPVVATSIPELMPYKKIIYMADTVSTYVSAVKRAIKENSALKQKLRIAVAKANTWVHRAKVLEDHLLRTFYPKVSVIILVYNHSDLSKISIDTTLDRSKYPNFEVLAVDNCSDQETRKMLEQYRGRKNIRLIFNSKNYGFAKGNNIGMERARGDYLLLLNNDVRVTPGWIERLVFHAKSNNVGLVGPVTNSIGNESKIKIRYDSENQSEMEMQSADYVYAHWGETLKLRNIAAFAWIKSRMVYNKIGGLDDRFGRGLFEDDDYCVRVGNAKLDILCAEDAFVHHYGGASTNWGSPEFKLLFNTNKTKFETKWKMKWTPHKYRKE